LKEYLNDGIRQRW